MITLIGTGHVFNLSARVKDKLSVLQPDVICVELDKRRYNALLSNRQSPKNMRKDKSSLPVLYRILGRFQENVAKEYGVNVGDEMVTAIDYAKFNDIPVELIDMDAQKLFMRMLASMSILEKLRLVVGSIFGGIFVSRKRIEKELKDFQDNYGSYMLEISKRFPTIKKTLIDDRNKHMANRLLKLNDNHDSVVALVGDGHIPGMKKLFDSKDVEVDVIRLKELKDDFTEKSSSNTRSYGFTTEYRKP